MSLLEWDRSLSVGIAELDGEHQGLVALINELYDAMRLSQGFHVLPALFEDLETYTLVHFKHEEQLMEQHGFPELLAHASEHELLAHQMRALRARYERERDRPVLTAEILTFLKNWLLKHIHGTDKRYGPFLNARGVR